MLMQTLFVLRILIILAMGIHWNIILMVCILFIII